MIRVCVAGITGWTGGPIAAAIAGADDLELVAGVSRARAGERHEQLGVPILGSVAEALEGAGVTIEGEREAVVVDVSSEDRPGKLAELAEAVGAAGVNLAACYVASGSRVVFSSDDAAGLRSALGM